MYAISLKAHQRSYAGFIPADRQADFDERYTFSKNSEEKYKQRIAPRIDDPKWYIWVAEADGKIVGFTLEERAAEHLILKHGLFVDPDYHGLGIGTKLFEVSLEIARPGDTLRLSVIENNERAKRLYEKHGFVLTNRDEKPFFGARQEVMELTVY